MDIEEFRKHGKEMIDYICQYSAGFEQSDFTSKVHPGYLKSLITVESPPKGENFENIFNDFQDKIVPGLVHHNHSNNFAHSPNGNSFPAILGELLSSALGTIGFSWASCPSATELETIVLDWYAEALGLPQSFMSNTPQTIGGGALQSSASECTLICMLAARTRAIMRLKGDSCDTHDSIYLPQLTAYASREAHASVDKAAKIDLVKLRKISTDALGRMRTDLLEKALQNDIKAGMTPFFVVGTIGTTTLCAFDDLTAIGKVCNRVPNIWFHVDGAYAGNSFILPEMRIFSKGLEYAESFTTSPSKLLLTNFDGSAMWVRDVMSLKSTFNVNPLYLQHAHDKAIDYRHYGIPLSRRFRALKLWFVFRTYGIAGLQEHVRNHINLARLFKQFLEIHDEFKICNDVQLGVVCFALQTGNEMTKDLVKRINSCQDLRLMPLIVNGKQVIKFCVTYEHATQDHVVKAWSVIKRHTAYLLLKKESRLCTINKKIVDIPRPISEKPNLYAQVVMSMFLRFSEQMLTSKQDEF